MSGRSRLPVLGARPPRSVAFLSAAFSGTELPSPVKGSNKALQLQLQQQQEQQQQQQQQQQTRLTVPAAAAAASVAASRETAAATAAQQQQQQQEHETSKPQEQREEHEGAEATAKKGRKHGSSNSNNSSNSSSSSSARDAAAKKTALKKTNRKSSSSSSSAPPQTLDSALALNSSSNSSSSSSSSRVGGRGRAFSPRRLARATEKQQNNVAQGVTCARLESPGFTSSLGRLVLNPGATFGPARAEAERLLCFVVTCEAGRLRFCCGEAGDSIHCQPHDEVLLRKGDVYSFFNESESVAAELTAVADFSKL